MALILIRERRAREQVEMSIQIGSLDFTAPSHNRPTVDPLPSSWSHRNKNDDYPGPPVAPAPVQPLLS